MPTVAIEGVRPEYVDKVAEGNLTQIKGWAAAILRESKDHAETAEEVSAWVKAAWWEHEDDFRTMALRADADGQQRQRELVMSATRGDVTPDLPGESNVDIEVESLMKLGEWLAKQAVKAWNAAHAVAAANDDDPEANFEPVAAVTAFTITAMLILGGSQAVMYALRKPGMTLSVDKTWHTQQDSRVRHSHQRLQGRTEPLTSLFPNGVDHPSDRNGEPGEVYNCRCWLTYSVTYGALGAAQGGDMGTPFEGILTLTGPDTMTGDGRSFDARAVTWDPSEAPWPLKFDRDDGDHSAAIVAQINEVWYDGTTLRGKGVFHDDSADVETQVLATRAMELLDVSGVSIELDSVTAEMRVKKEVWDEWQKEIERMQDEEPPEPEVPGVKDGRITVDVSSFDDWIEVTTAGRFRGAAIVDTAAFNKAKIAVAAALALSASGGESSFANPQFGSTGDEDPRLVWQKPQRPEETPGWGCPLTITDDGRVYGHVALRYRCHGAFAACVPAPDSGGDFSHFLTGEAERGTPTGPIILGTTHGVNADGTIKSHDHLANTGMAVADVTVGVDRHGTWAAGKLRPGITERQIADLRGSTLSGEWHAINGKLRLIGILAVNSPGYLIQRRSLAASFTLGASCCEGEDPMMLELANLRRELIGEWATKADREQIRLWLTEVS